MFTSTRMCLISFIFTLPGAFQISYHGGIYNQPQAVMESFVARSFSHQFGRPATEEEVTFIWTVVIAVLPFGSLMGDIYTQQLLDKFGRKGTLYIAATLNLFGSFLQAIAYVFNLFELLLIGRFLCGMATSSGNCANQLMVAEVTPTKHRGTAAATMVVTNFLCTILVNTLSLPTVLGTATLWPHFFTFNMAVLISFMAMAWNFPESPKHLVANVNHPDLALESLAFYNVPESEPEKLLETIYAESTGIDFTTSSWQIVNFFNFLKSHKNFLKPAIILFCTSCASLAICGVFALMNYGVYILREAGVNESSARYANLSYGLVGLLSAWLGLWLIECLGRRVMVLLGCGTTLGALTVIFISQTVEQHRHVDVPRSIFHGLAVAAVPLHALGVAPLIYVDNALKGELFPSFIRASAAIYSGQVWLSLSNILTSFAYLPLERKIGPLALFLLFIMPMIIVTTVLVVMCPETKGKDVSEIVKETANQ